MRQNPETNVINTHIFNKLKHSNVVAVKSLVNVGLLSIMYIQRLKGTYV